MQWYMAVTAQWLFHNYTMIENYTFLRNESQPLKFLYFRQVVVSAKCLSAKSPFVKLSVRQNVRSTKRPSAKCPFGKMSFRKMTFRKVSFGKMSGYRNRSCVTQHLSVFHIIGGRGDLDQAFSQKGVRASLDGFGRNIGRLWTPKILKGKKITSVFNEKALTKASSTFRLLSHNWQFEPFNRVLHVLKHQN